MYTSRQKIFKKYENSENSFVKMFFLLFILILSTTMYRQVPILPRMILQNFWKNGFINPIELRRICGLILAESIDFCLEFNNKLINLLISQNLVKFNFF